LHEKKYDVIFLQETHCGNDMEANMWGSKWEGRHFWNHGNSSSRGVAVLFRKNFPYVNEICMKDNAGRFMSFKIQIDESKTLCLTNIYAPNKINDRRNFFQYVTAQLSGVQCHHVIGGDFNSVFDPVLDRKSCSQISRADDTSRDLYDLISALEIEDIWRRRNPNKKEYTFTRNESVKNRFFSYFKRN
jgi:exonuclease III